MNAREPEGLTLCTNPNVTYSAGDKTFDAMGHAFEFYGLNSEILNARSVTLLRLTSEIVLHCPSNAPLRCKLFSNSSVLVKRTAYFLCRTAYGSLLCKFTSATNSSRIVPVGRPLVQLSV